MQSLMIRGHIDAPMNLDTEVWDRLIRRINEVAQKSVAEGIKITIEDFGNPINRPIEPSAQECAVL
jgi:hypothetical protein